MEKRKKIDFLYCGFMSVTEFSLTELKYFVVPSRINSGVIEMCFANRGLCNTRQSKIPHIAHIAKALTQWFLASQLLLKSPTLLAQKLNH